MKYNEIAIETLNEILICDSEAGTLLWRERPLRLCFDQRIWKAWNTKHAGKPALTISGASGGYLQGCIFRKRFMAHRVVWALHYNEWPVDQLDHINGVRTDNRICNLRLATPLMNSRNRAKNLNNSSGAIGVHWNKRVGKWSAMIGNNNKLKHIGYFDNKGDATSARANAEKELGYHPNHGKR